MSKNLEIAKKIKETADELGWRVDVRGDVLKVTKHLDKSDPDAFVKADSEYYSILGYLPTSRPGSIWGTDGGGVGALSAINSGVFKMNMSGGNKRVLNALRKLL